MNLNVNLIQTQVIHVMPETKEVRVLAALVGTRLGLLPWWEHRAAVLPEVYRQLGLPAYRPKRKRKRSVAPLPAVRECCVCLEDCGALAVIVPYGHRQACATCLRGCNGRCPICRAQFTEVLTQIYE